MSEKLGRRGLFGLFAKAAVAAPFVGKAMAEAASAAPPVAAPAPYMPRRPVFTHRPDPSNMFTISCTMGPFTDMRFADSQDIDEEQSWYDEPEDEDA